MHASHFRASSRSAVWQALSGGRGAFRDFQIEHCWRRHNEIGREPKIRRLQNTTASLRRRSVAVVSDAMAGL